MKISTQAAINLANALTSLNGFTDIIKDGERERPVQKPYKFAAEVRMAIAKNLVQLTVVTDAYNTTRENLIFGISGRREIAPPPPEMIGKPEYADRKATFDEQIGEFARINVLLLAELHDLPLANIKEGDLKLDINPIAFSTLAHMAPILAGDGWEAAKGIVFQAAAEAKTVNPSPLANGHAAATTASAPPQ